jgi:hypothetical protein
VVCRCGIIRRKAGPAERASGLFGPDSSRFAAAAEKSSEITKVGIKNNESPQYLTVWEKS